MNTHTTQIPGAGPAVRPVATAPETIDDRLSLISDRQHGLLQSWHRLVRRKWIALGVLAACVLAAILFTFTQPSLYRATATIEISRESARIINQQDAETTPAAGAGEFYQTQYGLLKSRSLMARVARELRLADNEAFLIGSSGNKDIMAAPRARREDAATGLLASSVEILPTRNSGLVDISASSPNGELSARIANSVAANFVRANLERRFSANDYASKFLRDELEKARARLETSERNAVNYAANREIIELNRTVTPTGETIAGQSLAETNLDILNRRLAEARAARIESETRLSAARRAGGDASASLADSSLQTLRTRRADLQAELSKQSATFGPEYPPIIALKQQIAALNGAISRQSGGVTRGLQSDYEAARGTEQQLAAQVASLKGAVTNLGRDRIQYNIFQREADTNRALYDSLLERYKEIGVAGGVGTNNVAIVDPAIAPGGPYTPRPMLNLLLALIVGGLAGAGLAILVDQLNDAIRDPSDVERIGVPLLGVIPTVEEDQRIEQLNDPKSPLTESFMAASAALRFATAHGVPRSMIFTSANPNEGKSTAALATSIVISRLGKRVLLVDGDMRNPSLQKLLEIDNKEGLANLLAGETRPDAFVRASAWQNLDVLTTGPMPPNPGELLNQGNLAELLRELEQRYDHVIVDAPPVIGLVDAPSIAAVTEATVFVIGANQTRTRSAIVSLRRLHAVNANIIGSLLTKFRSAESGYGYNYDYHYSS